VGVSPVSSGRLLTSSAAIIIATIADGVVSPDFSYVTVRPW
jgi:hypothetical protein